MAHLARPTRGHTIRSIQHAYLTAVDFAQDDIIRPELRNDAILASRSSVKARRQRRALLNRLPMEELERP